MAARWHGATVSVEVVVAEHAVKIEAHERAHEKHAAEFDKVWAQIEAARRAREDTNLQIKELTGNVGALSATLTSLDQFVRGDLRKAFIGGVATIVVLGALLVLALTGDAAAVHDAAASAIPDATP